LRTVGTREELGRHTPCRSRATAAKGYTMPYIILYIIYPFTGCGARNLAVRCAIPSEPPTGTAVLSDTGDILGIRMYRGLRTFALLDHLFLTSGPVAG
jgi:hypothetical protein